MKLVVCYLAVVHNDVISVRTAPKQTALALSLALYKSHRYCDNSGNLIHDALPLLLRAKPTVFHPTEQADALIGQCFCL